MGRNWHDGGALIYLTRTIGPWKVAPITWGHYELLRNLKHAYFHREAYPHDHAEALTLCKLSLGQAVDLSTKHESFFNRQVRATLDSLDEQAIKDWETLWLEQTGIPVVQGGVPGADVLDMATLVAAQKVLGQGDLLGLPARQVFDAAYYTWTVEGYMRPVDTEALDAALKLREEMVNGEQGQG